ncbi:hypothetical protein ADK60_37470 [Streptomyces sp. XY431]|uniref:hypothetical protein n=1 Tax=Streptomyces sp. XY431 TaxID=1415562 RepID=UPI0006B02A77|nr:hypothetical protein [Streptomyces sp. XY431]KOV10729.1 hypothetical protein ADK60_37470 [Streptomyces sp. XY431]
MTSTDTTDINSAMDSLQVAATALIADYSDIATSGRLAEHPDLVDHRLGLVLEMLAAVQAAVQAERASGEWPALRGHPGAEHDQLAAEYAHHNCDCPHCFHGGGPGDEEGDIWM